MNRRRFLAWSGAAAVVSARPSLAAPDWRMTVGELRCGGVLANRVSAGTLAGALGVAVRAIPLDGEAVIEAFHAGQIEFGWFDESVAGSIRSLMGERVISPLPGALILRSLPPALRTDVTAALFTL